MEKALKRTRISGEKEREKDGGEEGGGHTSNAVDLLHFLDSDFADVDGRVRTNGIGQRWKALANIRVSGEIRRQVHVVRGLLRQERRLCKNRRVVWKRT